MKKLVIKTDIDQNSSHTASEFLTHISGLSKAKVKDAMNKGAAWKRDRKGKLKRIRKATHLLHYRDHIEFYYNELLLTKKPPTALLLQDLINYSVWYKPPELMPQGTKYGDHCSLLRQAEVHFKSIRKVFLVHRLDREAAGLMLIAHNPGAASKLSKLFQNQQIYKEYLVNVLGDLSHLKSNMIELPLDDKQALTFFKLLSYDGTSNISTITANITTGRYHQIRRHFEMIGHPVIGDSKYGKGNKNVEGMKLSAVTLRFQCPFTNKEQVFQLSEYISIHSCLSAYQSALLNTDS